NSAGVPIVEEIARPHLKAVGLQEARDRTGPAYGLPNPTRMRSRSKCSRARVAHGGVSRDQIRARTAEPLGTEYNAVPGPPPPSMHGLDIILCAEYQQGARIPGPLQRVSVRRRPNRDRYDRSGWYQARVARIIGVLLMRAVCCEFVDPREELFVAAV